MWHGPQVFLYLMYRTANFLSSFNHWPRASSCLHSQLSQGSHCVLVSHVPVIWYTMYISPELQDLERFVASFNALMEHTSHVEQQLQVEQGGTDVETAEDALTRHIQIQDQLRKAPQNTVREGNELLLRLEQVSSFAGTSYHSVASTSLAAYICVYMYVCIHVCSLCGLC